MITLYGIPNCDTVKKTRKWLDNQNIEYTFSNFRENNLAQEKLAAWSTAVGWGKLLNKRSTTWRQLNESVKTNLNEQNAIRLMLEQPTLIKRPVLEFNQQIEVGFSEKRYQDLLG